MGCGSCSTGGGCSCGSKAGGYSGCGTGCPIVQVYDWLPTSTKAPGIDHFGFVEVAFKARRTHIYRNNRQLPVSAGDCIVVSAHRGLDFGRITMTGELVRLRAKKSEASGYVVRVASDKDLKRHEANRVMEDQALIAAQQAAKRRNLPLKLVDAEWQFDRKRIVFYYSAERRVKLGKLIGYLSNQYKTSVELRRLSPRRETAHVGGIGSCGRELCCSSWMQEIPPVSTRAATKQNLPLHRERLAGRCGQLKCCLNYELEHYMAALKEFPARKAQVKTDGGKGRVENVDIFARTVLIRYEDDTKVIVPLAQVQVLPRKKPATRKAR